MRKSSGNGEKEHKKMGGNEEKWWEWRRGTQKNGRK